MTIPTEPLCAPSTPCTKTSVPSSLYSLYTSMGATSNLLGLFMFSVNCLCADAVETSIATLPDEK